MGETGKGEPNIILLKPMRKSGPVLQAESTTLQPSRKPPSRLNGVPSINEPGDSARATRHKICFQEAMAASVDYPMYLALKDMANAWNKLIMTKAEVKRLTNQILLSEQAIAETGNPPETLRLFLSSTTVLLRNICSTAKPWPPRLKEIQHRLVCTRYVQGKKYQNEIRTARRELEKIYLDMTNTKMIVEKVRQTLAQETDKYQLGGSKGALYILIAGTYTDTMVTSGGFITDVLQGHALAQNTDDTDINIEDAATNTYDVLTNTDYHDDQNIEADHENLTEILSVIREANETLNRITSNATHPMVTNGDQCMTDVLQGHAIVEKAEDTGINIEDTATNTHDALTNAEYHDGQNVDADLENLSEILSGIREVNERLNRITSKVTCPVVTNEDQCFMVAESLQACQELIENFKSYISVCLAEASRPIAYPKVEGIQNDSVLEEHQDSMLPTEATDTRNAEISHFVPQNNVNVQQRELHSRFKENLLYIEETVRECEQYATITLSSNMVNLLEIKAQLRIRLSKTKHHVAHARVQIASETVSINTTTTHYQELLQFLQAQIDMCNNCIALPTPEQAIVSYEMGGDHQDGQVPMIQTRDSSTIKLNIHTDDDFHKKKVQLSETEDSNTTNIKEKLYKDILNTERCIKIVKSNILKVKRACTKIRQDDLLPTNTIQEIERRVESLIGKLLDTKVDMWVVYNMYHSDTIQGINNSKFSKGMYTTIQSHLKTCKQSIQEIQQDVKVARKLLKNTSVQIAEGKSRELQGKKQPKYLIGQNQINHHDTSPDFAIQNLMMSLRSEMQAEIILLDDVVKRQCVKVQNVKRSSSKWTRPLVNNLDNMVEMAQIKVAVAKKLFAALIATEAAKQGSSSEIATYLDNSLNECQELVRRVDGHLSQLNCSIRSSTNYTAKRSKYIGGNNMIERSTSQLSDIMEIPAVASKSVSPSGIWESTNPQRKTTEHRSKKLVGYLNTAKMRHSMTNKMAHAKNNDDLQLIQTYDGIKSTVSETQNTPVPVYANERDIGRHQVRQNIIMEATETEKTPTTFLPEDGTVNTIIYHDAKEAMLNSFPNKSSFDSLSHQNHTTNIIETNMAKPHAGDETKNIVDIPALSNKNDNAYIQLGNSNKHRSAEHTINEAFVCTPCVSKLSQKYCFIHGKSEDLKNSKNSSLFLCKECALKIQQKIQQTLSPNNSANTNTKPAKITTCEFCTTKEHVNNGACETAGTEKQEMIKKFLSVDGRPQTCNQCIFDLLDSLQKASVIDVTLQPNTTVKPEPSADEVSSKPAAEEIVQQRRVTFKGKQTREENGTKIKKIHIVLITAVSAVVLVVAGIVGFIYIP